MAMKDPHECIVQAWRVAFWKPGEFSIARFALIEPDAGTKIVFDHVGSPMAMRSTSSKNGTATIGGRSRNFLRNTLVGRDRGSWEGSRHLHRCSKGFLLRGQSWRSHPENHEFTRHSGKEGYRSRSGITQGEDSRRSGTGFHVSRAAHIENYFRFTCFVCSSLLQGITPHYFSPDTSGAD